MVQMVQMVRDGVDGWRGWLAHALEFTSMSARVEGKSLNRELGRIAPHCLWKY
jgi:hypothetical protein